MSAVLRDWLAATATAAALLQAGSALAFSDPFGFSVTTIAGGGSGRYFTGSPADGYTCKSCHGGGEPPQIEVLGLPLAGYKPGSRYEVVIRWTDEFEKMSLALELTDAEGEPAGRVRLPPEDELEDPEYCDPATDGIPASMITETVNGRQIIGMPDCGAKRVRFLWTAPDSDVGQIWFAGSVVSSDGEGDPYHDGVTDFGRVIGSPAIASSTTAECGVAAVRGSTPSAAWARWATLATLAAAAFALRHRRQAAGGCSKQAVGAHGSSAKQ